MDEVLDLSVREIKNAQKGKELVSNPLTPKHEIDRLCDHHSGHQKPITQENGHE